MDTTGLARFAIARLSAHRFGRDVPTKELETELVALGIDAQKAPLVLEELLARRLAQRTADGWRLVSPRVELRARRPIARAAWLH